MNTYFIKSIIYSAFILGVMACSSALDKKYELFSREKDYQEIQKQISAEEFQLLKDYVQKQETENENFSDYTYREILSYAKAQEKIRKDQELYLAELEKKKAKEEVIIRQKTKLLCSKKWKIANVQYDLGRTGDSITVVELTDAAVKAINGNGKRWKIYLSDGTYKEMFGQEEAGKGIWEFTSPDIIREIRPSDSRSILKNNVYILTIKILNDNQFRYIEATNHSAYGPSARISKLVTMDAKN